jgi:hypothetical protein
MRNRLAFVAYGTVIPDLRTLLYGKELTPQLATEVSERFFELDTFLRSSDAKEPSTGRPPEQILSDVYAERVVESGLMDVLHKAQKADCEIAVDTYFGHNGIPPCDDLLERFANQLPAYVRRFSDASVPSGADADRTIWIVRHMDRAEYLLRSRKQVILYETPDRLERELNLRGVMGEIREPN